VGFVDQVPHFKLEMTPERKQRFLRLSRQILDLLMAKPTTPVEALVLLQGIVDSLNAEYFHGTYQGGFFIPGQAQVPRTDCPGCNASLDRAANETGDRPREGDATVCTACGTILVFDKDTRPVLPSQVDLKVMEADPKIMSMVAAVKTANRKRDTLLADMLLAQGDSAHAKS